MQRLRMMLTRQWRPSSEQYGGNYYAPYSSELADKHMQSATRIRAAVASRESKYRVPDNLIVQSFARRWTFDEMSSETLR